MFLRAAESIHIRWNKDACLLTRKNSHHKFPHKILIGDSEAHHYKPFWNSYVEGIFGGGLPNAIVI